MDAECRGRIEAILDAAESDQRSRLLESEVYAILDAAGIDCPRHIVLLAGESDDGWNKSVRAMLETSSSTDVVLKILSGEIAHKTEAGGIAFCRADVGEIIEQGRSMIARIADRVPDARLNGVLLCERVDYPGNVPGTEILLSLRQDGSLGPVVVFGLGGLLTEWYGELAREETTWIVSAHDPIFRRENPPSLSRMGPAFRLLFDSSRVHKRPPLDPRSFWHQVQLWAEVAREFGIDAETSPYVLEELEVNPVVVARDHSVFALDGVGRFGKSRPTVRRRRTEKIRRLLEPRSAAVIGASGKARNAGRIILQNLRSAEGIEYGHLYPVHPKQASIDSIRCIPSIAELPERVDMAVVAVPAEAARDAIQELVGLQKTHSIILIPGGFAETGDTGLADEIIHAIEAGRSQPDGGPVVIGGNCLGIVSKGQYNTFFLPQYKLPFHEASGGNLVAISQSGAYLVTLTSNLDGVIFPKASISYGNQMDLTVSDFLEHYLDDPDVQVIACYVEGFQPLDGKRFVEMVREHRRRGRAVIVYKAGRTPLGAQAAASHTASLAGDYRVASSLMVSAGAIVAETLNQFEDLTKVFTMLYDRIPNGNRVGVISNAGFECSAAMDALYALELATFSSETKERIRSALPGIAHTDNPIDATPMATTPQFVQTVEAMLADPGIDSVVVSAVPVTPTLDNLTPDPTGAHSENIYSMSSLPQELIRLFRSSKKPIVAAIDSGRLYDDGVILLQRAGIPTYRKIDRATRALSRYCVARMA